MIEELCRSLWSISAVYWFWSEKHIVKREKDAKGGSILDSLRFAVNRLKKIDKAKVVIKEVNSWIEKLDKKYSVGQELDDEDKKMLDESMLSIRDELYALVSELDAEQRSLKSIETVIKHMENEFEPIRLEKGQIGLLREHITRIQNATISFVESSPTVRSFESKLRGLINKATSGELILTGYLDHILLTDFKRLSPKPIIKIISPELKKTKQDKTNLDALKRLKTMGAEVRFHPMIHSRIALSQSELIVGSGDIKSDCLGGRRYDAGIWSNNPILIESCKSFTNKMWDEAYSL